MAERIRLDIYLHRARLFKSRSKAAAACKDGRVLVNEMRGKSSTEVGAGDRLSIRVKGLYRELRILVIPGKNISREAAKETWRDETPQEVLEQRELIRRAARLSTGRREGTRPTKKERRIIDRLKGRS